MQSTTTCPTCNGEGKIITNKCSHCNGEGIVREEEIISINIPAGVSAGMQLTISGEEMPHEEEVLKAIYWS